MFKKIACLLLGVVAFVGLGNAAKKKPADWTLYPINEKAADYRLESIDKQSFKLSATRKDAPGKTMGLAIVNVNRNTWTHDKVVFSVRSLDGRAASLSVSVSYADGDKTAMKNSGGISVSGRNWSDVVLALDNDYGLGDRAIQIRQVKFSLGATDLPVGGTSGIEVADFRVCGPNEVSKSAAYRDDDVFVAVPAKATPAPAVRPDALKVFFAFDNEDVQPSRSRRKKGLWDEQQYWGFREILLERTDGAAVVTTNLDEAGAIVYASCRKNAALAKRIAARVTEGGVPLYATTEVLDPEVEALLPCTVGHGPLEDLPPRRRVVPADGRHPLARRGGYSDATFPVFRDVRAKDSGRVLFRYDGGPDAVVEGRAGRGRVLYSSVGLGASLVPGKEARDAFFLRLLGHLTGRAFPERGRARPKPSFLGGWWEGNDGFGHFGWEVGNGFLVENTSSRLEVSLGGVQYCLAAPRAGDGPRKTAFAVDRINPLAVGGTLTTDGVRTMRYDGSMAYPGLRWEVYLPTVELHLKNTLSYAAYLSKRGYRTVAVCEGEAIDPRDFAAPWLLLWNATDEDAPLMLVFGSVPGKVETMRGARGVNGLRLTASRAGGVGVIVPTWIWGSRRADTRDWAKGIPGEAVRRVNEWYPRAFRYPVAQRERFRLDERAGMVEIRDDFEYLETKDSFGTPTRPYAAIPPVAAALGAKGPDWFRAEADAKRTSLVTRYGPLLVADGQSRVEWAIRIPRQDLSTLPHASGFEKYDALFNSQFADAVNFSCGGGVRVDWYTDRRGSKADPENDADGASLHDGSCNLGLHGSLLGMSRNTPNPYGYTEENRRLIRRRLTWRLMEPLEDIYFKAVCRYRREPFSGRRYTIYMNSPRNISTVYEPAAFGSRIIYGDSNETVRMIVMCLQKLADQFGQPDVVKANWDTVSREVVSYIYAIDSWAYLCSGCLEWGGPGTVDMLNSEVGCMMEYARLAQIAGDEAEYAQAIYRAARRACPTMARFVMQDYYGDNGLADRKTLGLCLGFSESARGAEFRPLGRTRVWDCEIFDMSEGIPNTLVALYRDWGVGQLQREYIPYVLRATEKDELRYTVLATVGLVGGCTDARLREKLDEVVGFEKLNSWLRTDWPGMDTCSYVEYIYHRLTDSPVITDCRGVYLHDAQYDVKARTLTLDFTPVAPDAALAVDGVPLAGLAVGKRETRKLVTPGDGKPLMVNEDNDHFFHRDPSEMTREGLLAYVDSIIDGGRVTDMVFCPVGQPANYDSKAWEPVWKRLEDPAFKDCFATEARRRWPENCKRLHDAGIDPYRVWGDRCREKGVKFWISMRMNDTHFMTHPTLQGIRSVAYTRNHPEFWRYPDAKTGDAWKMRALNYARPEAYLYALTMAKELLERYRPDGFEVDWMRYVCHLTPGKEREEAHVLTRFMRDVKALAGSAKISVRLPSRYEQAVALGYEPDVWAKEGLVDVIIPCNKDAADFETDVADWRARCPGVLIVPGMDRFDCTHDERVYTDMAGYRGFADAMARKGADGLYLFNAIYAPCRQEIWTKGLDAPARAGQPKRYIASYPDAAPDSVPEASLCQLPRRLADGMRLTFDCGSAEGSTAAFAFGFDTAEAPAADGLRLTLNGRPVVVRKTETVTGFGKLYGDPKQVKSVLRLTFDRKDLKPGANVVTLAGDGPAQVYWAEIATE